MRVLLFLYDHPANPAMGGGGALRMQNLSRYLAARGHQVHWVAGWFPSCEDLPPEPNLRMSFIGRTPKLRTATYALTAAWRMREFSRDADVVIDDFSPFAPIFSQRLTDRKVVLQLQNFAGKTLFRAYPGVGIAYWLIEALYPRSFKNIVVLGEALRLRYSLPATIIPQGVADAAFATVPEAGDYIAFLGRIDFNQKGLDLLLKAAAKTGLPIRIAGKGPDLPRLQDALSSLPNVSYIGQLGEPEKFEFLAKSRYAIVPSRFEGEAMSIVEAAACAKAVLVSTVPEIAYAVDHGFGRSFPTGDASALAALMTEMWHDPALPEMGARGRAFSADRSWASIGARFERYLLDIVGGK